MKLLKLAKNKYFLTVIGIIVWLLFFDKNDVFTQWDLIQKCKKVSAQCAMCKEAAASSLKNDPSSMARSLNSGILYLMAVPYILLAFIFRKQIGNVWKKLRGKGNHAS